MRLNYGQEGHNDSIYIKLNLLPLLPLLPILILRRETSYSISTVPLVPRRYQYQCCADEQTADIDSCSSANNRRCRYRLSLQEVKVPA